MALEGERLNRVGGGKKSMASKEMVRGERDTGLANVGVVY